MNMNNSCKKCGKKYSEEQLKYYEKLGEEAPEYCKSCRKSRAKMAGVKSTFDMGDNTVLMTSFGRGNDAIKEKAIKDNVVEVLQTIPAYNAEVDSAPSKKVRVSAGDLTATPDFPKSREAALAGVSIRGYRDGVEKFFFGKTFDDNIHIQLAYNVMDIEKILAVHINNIIYTLDNVVLRNPYENGDFLGMLGLQNTYSDFQTEPRAEKSFETFKNFIAMNDKGNATNPLLSYFGSAFTKVVDGKTVYISAEEIYYILAMLGQTRQMLAHSTDSKMFLYNLDSFRNEDIRKDITKVLNGIYKNKIDSINNSFVEYEKRNLSLLWKIFGYSTDAEEKNLIELYYDFVVRKKNKNLGFSLKKIREIIIENYDINKKDVTSCEYDSIRHKLYKIFDFIIFEHFYDTANKSTNKNGEKIVDQLRKAPNDEVKEEIYDRVARETFSEIKSKLEEAERKVVEIKDGVDNKSVETDIYASLSKNNSFKIKGDFNQSLKVSPDFEKAFSNIKSSKYFIQSKNVNPFVKFMYLITLFIDGKEINDLLTTLINKFDNIASLIAVLDGKTDFIPEYEMFNDSKNICEQLVEVNSFARMEVRELSTKKIMFIEAVKILGTSDTDEKIGEYYDKYIVPQKKGNGNKVDHGLRNFIANNVIDSYRFRYLVRYTNSENISKLAKNRKVVEFVIRRLPEEQIERYYNLCKEGKEEGDKVKILVDKVVGMSFKNRVEDVKQSAASGSREEKDKETRKAIISFYLTILYLLTKNLVYINSRYFMAFHCLERDINILGGANLCARWSYDTKGDGRYVGPYAACSCILTRLSVSELEENNKKTENDKRRIAQRKWEKRRVAKYLSENVEAIAETSAPLSSKVRKDFRNVVEHLNAVQKASEYLNDIENVESYFAAYHYLVQRCLLEKDGAVIIKNADGNPLKLKNAYPIEQYHSYSKDFVKALNAPFGYNLPRFKNLSIADLFDMNDQNNG